MEKKYKLTKETKTINSVTLHRIQALRDFDNVKKGELGGWIQSETNLSHEGDCWVYKDAWVYKNAQVFGDAWVYGKARISGSAQVYGDACVYQNAQVFENALVYDNAWVFGSARVFGDAQVFGDAEVYWSARVSGKTRLQIGRYDEGEIIETPMAIVGSKYVINKSGNSIFIGCQKLTQEEWLGDKGKKLAIEYEFTEKRINEYEKYIKKL